MSNRFSKPVFLLVLLVSASSLFGCGKDDQFDVDEVVKEIQVDNEEFERIEKFEREKNIVEEDVKENQDGGADDNIDTPNWQTYRNDEYGFEFKYKGELKEDLYNKDENDYGSNSFDVQGVDVNEDILFSSFGFFTKEYAKEHKLDVDGPHSSFDFDLEKFNNQKDALNKGISYNREEITFINNKPYHVVGLPCEDSCTLRYTTYFNDIRVHFYVWATYDFHDKYTDSWVFHEEFRKKADNLIEQMEIK